MSYELKIDIKEDVLWVTAIGTRSLKTVLAMSNNILAACRKHKITRVLVDVRELEGKLPRMETYDLPDKHFPKMQFRGVVTTIAVVNREEFNTGFFENVAVNRGFNIHTFSDPEEALKWVNK